MDYYDEDIEDDVKAVGGDYDEYPYGHPRIRVALKMLVQN